MKTSKPPGETEEDSKKSKGALKKLERSFMSGFTKKPKHTKTQEEEHEAVVPLWGIPQLDESNWRVGLEFVHACVKWMKEQKGMCFTGYKLTIHSERPRSVEGADFTRYVGRSTNDLTGKGDFYFSPEEDCHSISSLVKRYFREMVDPLLTHKLYEAFIAADTESGEQRISTIATVLSMLPQPNLKVLEPMCKYLFEVSANSDLNLMYPTNLAIVFAPNILRPLKETPLKLISDAGHAAALVRTLIEEAPTIFDKAMQFKGVDVDDMQKTLRRNYTLHREQSKVAAKALMRERNLNEEDLTKTMQLAGDNIKAGKHQTLRVFFEEGDGDSDAKRPRARAKLSDIFGGGATSAEHETSSDQKQESAETSQEKSHSATSTPLPPLTKIVTEAEEGEKTRVRSRPTRLRSGSRTQKKYNSLTHESANSEDQSSKKYDSLNHSPRGSPKKKFHQDSSSLSLSTHDYEALIVPTISTPASAQSNLKTSSGASDASKSRSRAKDRKSVHRPQLQILRDLAEQIEVEETKKSLKEPTSEIFQAPGIVESIDLIQTKTTRGGLGRTTSTLITTLPLVQRTLKKSSSLGERDVISDPNAGDLVKGV